MSNLTLKEFLIKFTAIPEKFINEYYEFYELCKNDIFGIPAEKVIKYLGIKSQEKFEHRLRSNYKLMTDYIIIRVKQKSMKGIKNANYMLSFDCFEDIAQNSSTEKGTKFRDYYRMLRKFIDYYKNHIADKILDLTKTNEFIYIIMVNKDQELLKLGKTKDMRHRLQAYATGRETHPDVRFIMIVENKKRVEACAKLFSKTYQYKGNKELYKMERDKLKKIIFKCADLDKEVLEKMENEKENTNTYIVYDDSKTIEYLNLDGEVIGVEKPGTRKTRQSSKSSKSITKKTKTKK
jgi:phage anti-repressor protein